MRPDDDSSPPRAVLACADERAVAIALASARGGPFTVSCGGPVQSTSDTVVIDLGGLDAIAVGDGAVEVGAGVRVGALADRLAEHGRVVPVGRCRAEGVVGSVLAGGYGALARYYGLGADHLLSARVLLADGRVVRACADEHPDLFWALRGAGACAFGVVLSIRLRTRPAVRATAVEARWEPDYAAAVVDAWQHIAPAADRAVDLALSVTAAGGAPAVVARGVVVGTACDAEDVLSGFTARAGVPVLPRLAAWAPGRCAHAGPRPAKAEFFAEPMPAVAGVALVDGRPGAVEFLPWGGALAEGAGAAFGHRSPAYLVTHAGAPDAVARSWAATHPHGTGRAPQFHPDPELPPRAYFGHSLLRLRAIKHHYDPAGLFRPPLW